MALEIIKKVPVDHSEVDRVLTEWLETHRILAKDVRAYVIDRRIGQLEVLTLEIYTSGVDEIGPVPVIKFDKDITPGEVEAFKERFEHDLRCGRPFGHTGEHWPPGGTHPIPNAPTFWPGPGEPGHIAQERIDLTGWSEEEIQELHRTGVPPESRR